MWCVHVLIDPRAAWELHGPETQCDMQCRGVTVICVAPETNVWQSWIVGVTIFHLKHSNLHVFKGRLQQIYTHVCLCVLSYVL